MLWELLCDGALPAASAARVPKVLQAGPGGGLGVGWLLVTRVWGGDIILISQMTIHHVFHCAGFLQNTA